MDPAALKYAKTHEWIHIEGDIATVGISDFAVKHLTDLVYIELPEVGRTMTAGEEFGEVESVKAVSDLYAPVSGEIIEINESLADDLAILSEDPFGRGWMIKLKINDATETDSLLDRQAYEAQCAADGE
jgi:glycine cleavage system H protein